MAFDIIISVLAVIALCLNLLVEYKRDLMMFQQNSYRRKRYGKWLSVSGDTTSMWRLGAFAILFFTLSTFGRPWMGMGLCVIFGLSSFINLVTKKYKKPLVWTPRAIRIYSVVILITVVICALCEALFENDSVEKAIYLCALALLGCYCASHVIIILSNILLTPVEKSINNYYINDASRKLKDMPSLKIIGITGSYGKTSTKHFLYHILSAEFDTLMTPGSYNTTLGVVRTVREMLKPYNEVFIVEMGAKSPGDIKEICDLVHPHIGIVTAVGPQHLESFKTLARVQSTKFELVDSLPSDGLAVINDDFEKIAEREVTNTAVARYGIKNHDAAWQARDIIYTSAGTTFTVTGPDGFSLQLKTRLLGEANISDLLAVVVVAHTLGIPSAKIAAAVSSIEPVEHRLSIKRVPNGITILDDAFNSNPVGSRMALEVLGAFKGGKRIIITPGMIELGTEQDILNEEFGRHIAGNADIAIIVGQYNRDSICRGILQEKFPEKNLYRVDTFAEAQKLLSTIAEADDIVLYENDLPDTFK